MNRLISLSLLLLTAFAMRSQRIENVSATYTYYAPETVSVEEARLTALERARIQAIADAFGTVVSQNSTTVITDHNGATDSRFYTSGGSEVRGDWVETTGKPEFEIEFRDHLLVVTCSVKGKAREINSRRVDFSAIPLRNGTESRFKSDEFIDGDDLYLYFKTPVDGFLSVWLLNHYDDTAYCLLPYSQSPDTSLKVDRLKPYVFFSVDNDSTGRPEIVDEYTLTCNDAAEQNELAIIFSTEENHCRDINSGSGSVPRSLPAAEFAKWTADIKKHNSSTQIINHLITIKKQ